MKIDLIYLAGSLENSPDGGMEWRLNYQELLLQFLDAHAIIPNEAEFLVRPRGIDFPSLKESDPIEYEKIMRRYIELDLHLIDMSDIVIAHWNGEMSAGTISEIHHCYMTEKPVYLVTNDKKNLPGWSLAEVGHQNIWPDFSCLLGHLAELKYGT